MTHCLACPWPVAAQALRGFLLDAVLHTDMAMHKSMIDTANSRMDAAADGSGPPFPGESHEDRQKLVALLLHSADLNSAAMSPEMDRRLASQVAKEFKAQVGHVLIATVMLLRDFAEFVCSSVVICKRL